VSFLGGRRLRPVDPTVPSQVSIESFLVRVHLTPGCWYWRGGGTPSGYGTISWREKGITRGTGAHRMAYRLLVGPIPYDHEVEHLCHTLDRACAAGNECPHRRCVNPAHLQALTKPEHARRPQHRTVVTPVEEP
jgi:hypothetical protein